MKNALLSLVFGLFPLLACLSCFAPATRQESIAAPAEDPDPFPWKPNTEITLEQAWAKLGSTDLETAALAQSRLFWASEEERA